MSQERQLKLLKVAIEFHKKRVAEMPTSAVDLLKYFAYGDGAKLQESLARLAVYRHVYDIIEKGAEITEAFCLLQIQHANKEMRPEMRLLVADAWAAIPGLIS